MKSFRIDAYYSEDEYEQIVGITLKFDDENTDTTIAWALKTYVDELYKKHSDDGLNVFKQVDMRIFSS